MSIEEPMPYRGASIAVLTEHVGETYVVAIDRDDDPGIRFPGRRELPGGTLEPGETPLEAALRELREETAISLEPGEVEYAKAFRCVGAYACDVLFGAHVKTERVSNMHKGSEGKALNLVRIEAFVRDLRVIQDHRERLLGYIAARSTHFLPQAAPHFLEMATTTGPLA
ncbi:MAG TPA: NUDIX domain-containing protein [Candidatus Saccharimonadales bacterium]|nr:NUDIX domain-containing protein [Candidatus Saccharimonadales bacterium]